MKASVPQQVPAAEPPPSAMPVATPGATNEVASIPFAAYMKAIRTPIVNLQVPASYRDAGPAPANPDGDAVHFSQFFLSSFGSEQTGFQHITSWPDGTIDYMGAVTIPSAESLTFTPTAWYLMPQTPDGSRRLTSAANPAGVLSGPLSPKADPSTPRGQIPVAQYGGSAGGGSDAMDEIYLQTELEWKDQNGSWQP